MEMLKLIITGTLGTLGFAVFFNVKPKHVPFAAIGGAIATSVYVLVGCFDFGPFATNLLATLACVLYSTIMARVLKTPSLVFITASIIPLVPGGALFYTMSNLILGDTVMALSYGMNTLLISLGIAVGIVVESLIVNILTRIRSLATLKQ
jgi:uncharacterized membrane protein YjjB (DUF3815 family)